MPEAASFITIFASPIAQNTEQHYKLYLKLANKIFQTL